MVDRMLAQMDVNDHQPQQSGEFVLARTSKEQSCFRTLKPALRKLRVMVQPLQNTNALYISSMDDWKQQATTYLTDTSVFSLIGTLHSEIPNRHIHNVLIQMNNGVATALDVLFRHQAITITEYERRISLIQSNQCHINQLYFLPTVQQVTSRPVHI